MFKVFIAGSFTALLAVSVMAADTGAPKPPKPDANGAVVTKDALSYLALDLKPKVFGDDKTLACYRFKRGKSFDAAYTAVAKTCQTKILKDVPPLIRGPFEMQRLQGPLQSCLEVSMRDKQKLTQRQVYECQHGPTK